MKKLLMSLMLLGFMLTLAACGGDTSEPAVPEDNTAEEATPDTTPEAEEPADDPAEEPAEEPTEEPAEEPTEEPAEEPTEPEDEPEVPTDSESGEATDDGYSDPDISGDDETTSEDEGYTDAPDGPGRINADGELELTLEDLSYYDGTDGKKAYVAVDGVIYDMSGSSRWSGGNHNGYQAGQDLTSVIDNISPHGRSTLTRVPTVGVLIESEDE